MSNTKNYSKQDPKTICSLFDSIADNYDKTNGILSLQLHKKWNSSLIQSVLVPNQPKIFLDLCCGTGAIAYEYLQMPQTRPTVTYMLDFSPNMLKLGQARLNAKELSKHDIHFIQADAELIPLMNESIDCVTVAYGIRNIKNPANCIREVYRVLRPGGVFGILELTEPKNRVLRLGHSFYLRTVLPILGKLCTSNKEAYSYLCTSIPDFIPPEKLRSLLEETGFQKVTVQPLFGGIATILKGTK